ncbi:hypothetical protein CF326_g3459 [Tilletia indica]|nr:hypothetical protein CF326_g3459 [Tilletia indica]
MTAPYFLTLAPIDSSLPAQAVAFSPSDHIQLLLGGVHVDYYRRRRPPHHTADFIFDEQRITPDHCDLTLFHQTPYLTNRDSDGTTRVNGHPLPKDERVVLRHGDKIEIGYLGEYNGVFSSTLALAVHISTSPPDFGLQPLSSDSLLSASTSAFVGFRAVQDLEQQLRRELASVRKQLQDALDAAAAHTCVSPSSPRPYGTLLSDLRDRVLDDSAVASSASSAPSAGSHVFYTTHLKIDLSPHVGTDFCTGVGTLLPARIGVSIIIIRAGPGYVLAVRIGAVAAAIRRFTGSSHVSIDFDHRPQLRFLTLISASVGPGFNIDVHCTLTLTSDICVTSYPGRPSFPDVDIDRVSTFLTYANLGTDLCTEVGDTFTNFFRPEAFVHILVSFSIRGFRHHRLDTDKRRVDASTHGAPAFDDSLYQLDSTFPAGLLFLLDTSRPRTRCLGLAACSS